MTRHLNTPRTRRDWTLDEDARLADLRAKNLSLMDIGVLMGRPHTSIKSRIETLARHAAAPPAPPAPADTRKVRKCLCCGREFNSDGPHNRLCGPCRSKSVSPYELYA